MRRSALALVLLLAAAPVANATQVTPGVKPDLRAAEGAAPIIRSDVVPAPARVEAQSIRASTVQRLDTRTILIFVLVVLAVASLALI